MKSGNNTKTLILLVILGITLAILYSMNKGSAPSEVAGQEKANKEAVTILADLQTIDFNFSILKNAAFVYLKDITSPPLNLPVGRQNPFTPIN